MSDYSSGDRGLSTAEVINRLEGLVGQPGVPEAYVRWRIALLQAQAAAQEALCAIPAQPIPLPRPPLPLRPEHVPFPRQVTEALLQRVLAACRQFGHSQTQWLGVERSTAVQSGLLDAQTLRACWSGDTKALLARAGDVGLAVELLELVGRVLVAPHVAHALAPWPPDATLGLPSDGTCPACGSLPCLAGIEGQGSGRVLYCSLCGRAWRFPRLRCPFCAGEDPDGFELLQADGQMRRWLEACARCRHYLRTVDLRTVAGPLVLLAEDAAGLYLDALAEKEGYRSGPLLAAMQ